MGQQGHSQQTKKAEINYCINQMGGKKREREGGRERGTGSDDAAEALLKI
jgi:hypothetical protein